MEFEKFDKIPRLSRDIIITEKIDGTNAQVCIVKYEHIDKGESDFITKYCLNLPEDFEEGTFDFSIYNLYMFAGSRTRWLDTSSKGDNFTFAKWVQANAEELFKLGEGRHYGEWYGQGIQRNYGLDEKRFALFNVGRWTENSVRPTCCEVVPILYEGMFNIEVIEKYVDSLKENGSRAVKNFMNPEGIVIYQPQSGRLFKKTVKDDEKRKEQVKKEKSANTTDNS